LHILKYQPQLPILRENKRKKQKPRKVNTTTTAIGDTVEPDNAVVEFMVLLLKIMLIFSVPDKNKLWLDLMTCLTDFHKE